MAVSTADYLVIIAILQQMLEVSLAWLIWSNDLINFLNIVYNTVARWITGLLKYIATLQLLTVSNYLS
jgi:hypothetical protein